MQVARNKAEIYMEYPDKAIVRARNTAYRLLTFRPRSNYELEQKLREKTFPEPVIQTVMQHLQRLGYIDDRKFAAQWAASRARLRGYGRRRIEQELRLKGVDQQTIHEALTEVIPPENEREIACKIVENKLRTIKNSEPRVQQRRLAGFLERKGFSHEIIWDILRAMRT